MRNADTLTSSSDAYAAETVSATKAMTYSTSTYKYTVDLVNVGVTANTFQCGDELKIVATIADMWSPVATTSSANIYVSDPLYYTPSFAQTNGTKLNLRVLVNTIENTTERAAIAALLTHTTITAFNYTFKVDIYKNQ